MVAATRPVVFKAPPFERKGGVDYFMLRFKVVVEANEWGPTAALLHLRKALRNSAQDCGSAATIPAIFEALTTRDGLSPKEAISKLNTLLTPLQKHAVEVGRLVGIVHADLPEEYQALVVLETFCSTLGNAYLQRHLLAVATPTVKDAVRAGNEFLQIRTVNY